MTDPTDAPPHGGQLDRVTALRMHARILAAAAVADSTISGATLILPNGETIYMAAADALAMTGGPARGRA